MSPNEAIMLALATASAARMQPNGLALNRPAMAAYLELAKQLSRAGGGGIDPHMLEIAPGSQERQRLLAQQLESNGIATDPAVLRQSRQVLEEILAQAPQAATAIFASTDVVAQALATLEDNLEVTKNGNVR